LQFIGQHKFLYSITSAALTIHNKCVLSGAKIRRVLNTNTYSNNFTSFLTYTSMNRKKTRLLTLVLLLPIIFPFQHSSLLYLVSSSSSLAFPFHKTRQEWSFRSQPVCRDLVSIMMLQKLYLYTIYVCSIPVVMSVGVF